MSGPSEGRRLFGRVIEIAKRWHVNLCVVLPERWIVECTFGWFSKHRRLSNDDATLPASSKARCTS